MSATAQHRSKRNLDDWFMAEILPLEPMLMRFLQRKCRYPVEVADLRQDIYIRVYEAARIRRPDKPKAFLFTVARNLIIDYMRRQKILILDQITDFDSLNVPDNGSTPESEVSARDELRQLQGALDKVPARQREVIVLRKVRGLSQRDVAKHMGITEDTVERHLSKGIRALAHSLLDANIETGLKHFMPQHHALRNNDKP